MKTMKIVICGNYGAGNVGDEAILLSLIQKFRGAYPKARITVLCSYPSREKKHFKEFSNIDFKWLLPAGIRSFLRGLFLRELLKTGLSIRHCDLFILGGGGLFADDESKKAVFLWGLHLFAAKLFHKKILVESIGVGPLTNKFSTYFTKKALGGIGDISVRDKSSQELLSSLGICSKLSHDPVFDLNVRQQRSIKDETGSSYKVPYIILSLRPWKAFDQKVYKIIAQALDSIVAKYGLVIRFIPFQKAPQNDASIMNKIVALMEYGRKVFIHPYGMSVDEILEEMRGAEMVIGMRLHSVILAILAETPFVVLKYSQKNEALLERMPELKGSIVGVDELPKLYDIFKTNWNKRQAVRKSLLQVKNRLTAQKQ